MTTTPRSRNATSRYVPVVLFGVALAVVVAALPTSLRPPQQPPNASAELSPDAPPDPNQEAIVASLNRGTSGTAGAEPGGDLEGPAEPTAAGAPQVSLPPPPPPRFCPNGYGDPPRQVESFYAAPCAGAWQGDNGGATYKGVSANEVRIGFVPGNTTNEGMALSDTDDNVISDEPRDGESAAYRTWRVYQQYFNSNFQLWARHLRFVVHDTTDGGQAQSLAAVQALDEQYHVFGVGAVQTPALEEAARRQLVSFGGLGWSDRLYAPHQPHMFAWDTTGTTMMQLSAEYLCKRLAGSPAQFAGGLEQGKPRKFGVITAQYAAYSYGSGSELEAMVKRQCGIEVVTVTVSEGNLFESLATSVSRFRGSDVTTIVVDIDLFWLSSFLQEADSQGYFPEWFIAGTWHVDDHTTNFQYGLSKTQWSHAFGLSARVMPQYVSDTDYYRAYKSIDPANEPTDNGLTFSLLLQVVNGLQMAGPELTPETFREGLNKMGRRANEPFWSVGGGYGRGDYGYADDMAEIWWDTTAPNPYSGVVGTFRWVDCGRRHKLGEIPAGAPTKLFDPAGSCSVRPGQA